MFAFSPRKFHSLLILPALLSLLFMAGARVPDNHPPVAVDDSYTVHGGADLDLKTNDSDPDGDPLTINGFPQLPAHGTIYRFAGDGVGYSADYGYVGSDTFTYTVCDGAGGCDDASVTLDVVNSLRLDKRTSTQYTAVGSLGPFFSMTLIPRVTR